MSHQLFVQNLLPTITDEQIRALFAEVGDVVEVQRPTDRETGQPRRFAFVTMKSAEGSAAAMERFDGYEYEDQTLSVKVARPRKSSGGRGGGKPKKNEVQMLADEIAGKLEETEKRPRTQIRRIIEEAGADFAQQLLQDTLEIEVQGGMETLDGKRRRTVGGVFFKLAKERLPADIRAKIFPNWQELKKRKKAEKAAKRAEDEKKQARQAAKKTATQAKPGRAKSKKPAPEEAKQELAALRQAEKEAEKQLAEIKAARGQGSMMAALKELADIRAKIAALLRQHPGLR